MAEEKIYLVPVTWEACGCVKVRGLSPEDAAARAKAGAESLGLPKAPQYVDGSFKVNVSDGEICMVIEDNGAFPEEPVQEPACQPMPEPGDEFCYSILEQH